MRRTWAGILVTTLLNLPLLTAGADAAVLSAADLAFTEKKIVAHWELTDRGQIAEAHRRGIDVLEDHPDPRKGYITILVDASELIDLESAGYKIHVVNYNLHARFAEKTPGNMGGFRTFTEIEAFLDSITAAHPTLATAKFTIGMTYEGRQQWVIKISDNPNVDEAEPEVFFNALHHAREPSGCAVLLETIRRLLDGYGVDPRITNLVDTREIYFCPVVNPDGYVHNETLLDLGFAPMWRKNRNTSYGVGDAVGADLNRNYGYQWGYDNVGSSGNPVVSTFRGDSAFSEPETQNMRAFVNSRDFIFILNYHTYSDLFLWPWGYTQIYSPDDALFNAIGDSVASFNGYTAQIGWQLYVTNGDSDDWNYGATNEHAKIYSFTPEVGGLNDSPSGESQGFWPFPDSIAGQVEENQEPNLLVLELADGPERLLPAEIPVWVGPDTANSGDYTLLWSDPGSGGPNAAVSYRLREIFGRHATSDDVEAGDGLWDNVGFTLSTARAVSATHSYFGGASPWLNNSLTAKHYSSVGAGDTVRLNIWYEIETDWDYAYVEASADGSNWVTLEGNVTTATNPNGNNLGNGITGSSGGWVAAKFGLDAYAGGDVLVRLRYRTDGFVLGEGVYFDDITMLTSVDSVVTIADPLSQADFNVTGKTGGSYWYDLRATDGEGQSSVTSPPHGVFVSLGTCAQDCACHADPICDAQTNVLDVVQTVNVAFKGAPATTDPGCPRERTDVDCTGATNVLDVVRLVNVAFKGQSAAANFCDPCAP